MRHSATPSAYSTEHTTRDGDHDETTNPNNLSTLTDLRRRNRRAKNRVKSMLEPLRDNTLDLSKDLNHSGIQSFHNWSASFINENASYLNEPDTSSLNKEKGEKLWNSVRSSGRVQDSIEFEPKDASKYSSGPDNLKQNWNTNLTLSKSSISHKEQSRQSKKFQDLVDKYHLRPHQSPAPKTNEERFNGERGSTLHDKPEASEIEILELHSRLSKYAKQLKDKEHLVVHLKDQITQLNSYIDFLESNFSVLYKKSNKYKLDKLELQQKNQQLMQLNEQQKSLLKGLSFQLNQNTTKGLNITQYDDSTTEYLINFKLPEYLY